MAGVKGRSGRKPGSVNKEKKKQRIPAPVRQQKLYEENKKLIAKFNRIEKRIAERSDPKSREAKWAEQIRVQLRELTKTQSKTRSYLGDKTHRGVVTEGQINLILKNVSKSKYATVKGTEEAARNRRRAFREINAIPTNRYTNKEFDKFLDFLDSDTLSILTESKIVESDFVYAEARRRSPDEIMKLIDYFASTGPDGKTQFETDFNLQSIADAGGLTMKGYQQDLLQFIADIMDNVPIEETNYYKKYSPYYMPEEPNDEETNISNFVARRGFL